MAWATATAVRTRARVQRVDSAAVVVTRGLTFLVIVWEMLWVLSDPRLWPTQQGAWWAQAACWLAIASWGALVVVYLTRRESLRQGIAIFNVAAVLLAGLSLIGAESAGAGSTWADGAYFDLGVGAAGFLLAMRLSVPIAASVVLVELGFVLTRDIGGGVDRVEALDLLYPLFTLAAAAASIGARKVLTDVAGRADRAEAESAAADVSRERALLVAQQLSDRERLLHETVLNTLVALSRGGLGAIGDGLARLADKCSESAVVLREFLRVSTDEWITADELFGGLRDDAQAMGITVSADLTHLDKLPPRVHQAFMVAAREALANAIRHSGARDVRITARLLRQGVVVCEVVDNGRGFDVESVTEGFGLSQAIAASMAEVHGTADIQSTMGEGTTVILRWHPQTASAPALLGTAGFVVPVLVSFAAYCIAAALITWPIVDKPVAATGAIVIYLLTAAILIIFSRRGWLTWALVVVVCAAGASVYVLQSWSMTDAPSGLQLDWASAALVSMFIVVAATGPSYSWAAVLVTWLIVQGDPVAELLSPGTAVIVAGSLFGRSIRRMATQLEESRHLLMEAQAGELAAQDMTERIRQRYAGMDPVNAIALLESIGNGVADPDDPYVRQAAAREERYVRAVMRLDPTRSVLHRQAATLVQCAHARRVDLVVDVALDEDDSLSSTTGISGRELPSWMRAFEHAVPGTAARLTCRREDDHVVVRLVVQVDEGGYAEMTDIGGIDTDPTDPTGFIMMWETAAVSGVDQ